MDWILTGASRGIGRALALSLGRSAHPGDRLFVLARDPERLDSLATELAPAREVVPLTVDLSRIPDSGAAGEQLASQVHPGATLIHNAGLWPGRRELVNGLEKAFSTNCLCPLALQVPLLEAGRLSRVLVISAGLIEMGRFDPARTPAGDDFSAFRTYCTTKLAGAIALREAARRNPEVDFLVMHPGVVRTDLGDRPGFLAWIVRQIKRKWESPEACAARLARVLALPRWEPSPGQAPWYIEEQERPWPKSADRHEQAVLAAVARLLPAAAPG